MDKSIPYGIAVAERSIVGNAFMRSESYPYNKLIKRKCNGMDKSIPYGVAIAERFIVGNAFMRSEKLSVQ